MVASLTVAFLSGIVVGMLLNGYLNQEHKIPDMPEAPPAAAGAAMSGETLKGKLPKMVPPPPEQGGIALGRTWRYRAQQLSDATKPEQKTTDSLDALEKRVAGAKGPVA